MDEIIITLRNDKIRRIYRTATPEELAEHQRIRAEIAAELPELRQRGRELLETLKIDPSKIAHSTPRLNGNTRG
ncbi:MAG: hypothetical protein ACOYNY_45915 [Caldilineaceae bacterium]